GDVDHDEVPDLIVGRLAGPYRLFINNAFNFTAGGTFDGEDVGTDTLPTNAVALGDLNRDGYLDVVAATMTRNRYYLNNGTVHPFQNVAGVDVATDSGVTNDIVVVDVDGDGYLDVVAGNAVGRNRLYLSNQGTGFVPGRDLT